MRWWASKWLKCIIAHPVGCQFPSGWPKWIKHWFAYICFLPAKFLIVVRQSDESILCKVKWKDEKSWKIYVFFEWAITFAVSVLEQTLAERFCCAQAILIIFSQSLFDNPRWVLQRILCLMGSQQSAIPQDRHPLVLQLLKTWRFWGDFSCCSALGWCGNSKQHCSCKGGKRGSGFGSSLKLMSVRLHQLQRTAPS